MGPLGPQFTVTFIWNFWKIPNEFMWIFFQKFQIQLMGFKSSPPKAAGAPRFLDVRSGEPSELAEIAGLRSTRLVGALRDKHVVISVWITWISGTLW